MTRKKVLAVVALLILAVVSTSTSAMAQDSEAPGKASEPKEMPSAKPQKDETIPDQIIVKFKENASASTQAETKRQEGLEKKEDLDLIDAEVYKVKGQSAEEAVRALESKPDVEYAELDYIRYPLGYGDERRFGELWGLNNTGQSIEGTAGTAEFDLNGLEASKLEQGDPNLIVAVIDDGVDFSHPDLKDRAWKNPGESGAGKETNRVDDDGNGYVDDVNGWDFVNNDNTVHNQSSDTHGTHVSGTIAASVNGEGVVGVAPNVKIMALNFLGSGTNSGAVSKEIKAIEYATTMGAKISNNSYGAPGFIQAEKDAIEASGQLFAAAAGNEGINNDTNSNRSYPASYDSSNILSVAAMNNKGNLPFFSNYGATSVDIAAPGVSILSSVPSNAYSYKNGTSMAAPHATGVAALVASKTPSLLGNAPSLKKVVMDAGKPLPATAGKTVTGDMIDANKALTGGGGGGGGDNSGYKHTERWFEHRIDHLQTTLHHTQDRGNRKHVIERIKFLKERLRDLRAQQS
jgi:subtilisin family serine protease